MKPSGHSEAGKKGTKVRKLRAVSLQTAKTRQVRWVESDELLDNLGHGVQFLHDELRQPQYVVAFLEGFGWRGGGSATVRLLGIRPSFITPNGWSEIIESTREGILTFLSDEGNLNYAFRHGPIQIEINA
jgi:hypothetical protein